MRHPPRSTLTATPLSYSTLLRALFLGAEWALLVRKEDGPASSLISPPPPGGAPDGRLRLAPGPLPESRHRPARRLPAPSPDRAAACPRARLTRRFSGRGRHAPRLANSFVYPSLRSEERRAGKECVRTC